MNKLNNNQSAIILPLKEVFSNKGFGAVSIWVKDYIKSSKSNDLVFCKKLSKNYKYLTKNIVPIKVSSIFYTNNKYIEKINNELIKRKINIVEIHNRPEYALYLIKNNPNLKINLIFHNNPNELRFSNSSKYKNFLLDNCNKVIFVSNWVKKQFFLNLDIGHKNNTDVIYNFINPIKKFPNKEKIIIFSGKLNKSKGFHIFGQAIIKILDNFPDWKAVVYGNEQRETFSFKHKRLETNNWIDHKKLLKIYEKCSISVVNPTWEEPFGRTALESASRGCAVITSKSGGLSETFKNNLILDRNTPQKLFKLLSKLIKDKKFLKKIQNSNFNNVLHYPAKSINRLNLIREKIDNNYKKKKISYKILHISNFGIRTNHRLFNLSISKKISNGLIRNGHDVIDFDYRNKINSLFKNNSIDQKILEILENYRPELIILGHNNSLSYETLNIAKKKFNTKIALWYEDHVIQGDPNYKNNLNLIEKNSNLIDQYFITTAPDIIKTKINKNKLNFLPIPVDPNIESEHFYEISKSKDLFFALSNGVNFGKLKKNTVDERLKFIEKLIICSKDRINFNILGLFNEQPKWNYAFNNELMISKTALNLSRGGPNKYASSNRIASIMGNGVLPFIDEKIKYQDFFDNDEIETYSSPKNLISKLSNIIHHEKKLIIRSKNAKKRYFDLFNNRIIADFIVHKVFDIKRSSKFIWEK